MCGRPQCYHSRGHDSPADRAGTGTDRGEPPPPFQPPTYGGGVEYGITSAGAQLTAEKPPERTVLGGARDISRVHRTRSMITLRGVTTIPLYSPSGTRPTSRFAPERNGPAEVLRGIVEAQTNTASSANRVQRPRWTPMATLKRNRTVIVGRGIWPCSLGLERTRTPRQRPRNRRLPLRLRRLVLRISHRSGGNRQEQQSQERE